MLNRKLSFVAVAIVLIVSFAGYVSADRVNPASNVTADSDNTAGTIVLRDSSGNFSAGTITATITGNIAGTVNTTSILNSGPTQLAVKTTTQLLTTNSAVGSAFLVTEGTEKYSMCASTSAVAGFIYIALSSATRTLDPNALGTACIK